MKTRIMTLLPGAFPAITTVDITTPEGLSEAILSCGIRQGYMEHVTVYTGFDGGPAAYRDMFVDEEGKLRGLLFNAQATAIYWANSLAHNPKMLVAPPGHVPDVIVGPAVLFEQRLTDIERELYGEEA